jgi:hypothetical protein
MKKTFQYSILALLLFIHAGVNAQFKNLPDLSVSDTLTPNTLKQFLKPQKAILP